MNSYVTRPRPSSPGKAGDPVFQCSFRRDLLSGGSAVAIAGAHFHSGGIPMSVQMVLLPVFVLVGLTFFLLLWMAGARRSALVGGETKIRDVALGQQNWPTRATQVGNC